MPTPPNVDRKLAADRNLSDVNDAATARSNLGASSALTRTAVKTSAYTAAAGELVPVDTTSGAVTVTLPAAPATGSRVAVKHVIQGSTNTVTVATGGSDVFNKTGGSTSVTLTLVNQSVQVQYDGGIWSVVAGDLPLSGLDARYAAAGSGGGGSLTVQDEGSPLATAADTINFVGSGVTATGTGATKTVTIPGGGGTALTVQDEGSPLTSDATTINFVGAGVTASGTGSTKTVTIPGGASFVPASKYTLPSGAVAATHDRTQIGMGGLTLVSGSVHAVAIVLRVGDVVSSLSFKSIAGYSSVTHSWMGLADANRVILAISADDTSTPVAAFATKTYAMGTPYTVTTEGMYYAFVMIAATSPAVMGQAATSQSATNIVPMTTGTANTSQTTPLSVGATLTAFTGNTLAPYIWAS